MVLQNPSVLAVVSDDRPQVDCPRIRRKPLDDLVGWIVARMKS